MRYPAILAALALGAVLSAPGATPAAATASPTGFPFTDEDLNYSVNWPSGLSLGDAHLHAKHNGANWNFSFSIEAGVPGFAVKDTYKSVAVPDFCAISFERDTVHGSHAAQEKETIDRERSVATRVTLTKEGGKSDFPVPMCVKDALTLLFFTRRELGQGRVPSAQNILMGGLYDVRMDYAGAPMITVDGKSVQTDKVICTIKTAASSFKFDTYYARDPARTLLLVNAPLAMGSFSMELVH
jgi:hypothetical protein